MRDLFRSGSAAQFLIHGNVFDVVPAAATLLSLPAFLDEVMFATYDVVLRYDRSRGVRATRGADDWGAWLDAGARREGQPASLLREPGSALELIDRYLLRTLNLKALGSSFAQAPPRQRRTAADRGDRRVRRVRRAARRRAAARRRLRRQHRQGARLGQRSGHHAVEHRHGLISEGLHDLNEPGGRQPARRGAARPAARRSGDDAPTCRCWRRRSFRSCRRRARCRSRRWRAVDRPEPRRRADGDRLALRNDKAHHLGVAGEDQEGTDRTRMPGAARVHRIPVHARQRRRP